MKTPTWFRSPFLRQVPHNFLSKNCSKSCENASSLELDRSIQLCMHLGYLMDIHQLCIIIDSLGGKSLFFKILTAFKVRPNFECRRFLKKINAIFYISYLPDRQKHQIWWFSCSCWHFLTLASILNRFEEVSSSHPHPFLFPTNTVFPGSVSFHFVWQ